MFTIERYYIGSIIYTRGKIRDYIGIVICEHAEVSVNFLKILGNTESSPMIK